LSKIKKLNIVFNIHGDDLLTKSKVAENVEIVEIKTDFIKLDQLLKWTNLTGSGSEAKMFILNGDVKVNGEVELRRGKKIHEGDIVEFNGEKITVKVQK